MEFWLLVGAGCFLVLIVLAAIPSARESLGPARLQAIKANLRTIDNMKTQWAAENRKGRKATPSESDLAPYFNGGKFPSPVVGETYRINPVDAAPVAVTPSRLLDIPQGGTITMDGNGPGK